MDELRALAPQQSDYTICQGTAASLNPNLQRAASEEAYRRGLNCSGYAQANQAQMMNGIQLLQMARPQPVAVQPLIPPTINCRSVPGPMGSVNTTCQ